MCRFLMAANDLYWRHFATKIKHFLWFGKISVWTSFQSFFRFSNSLLRLGGEIVSWVSEAPRTKSVLSQPPSNYVNLLNQPEKHLRSSDSRAYLLIFLSSRLGLPLWPLGVQYCVGEGFRFRDRVGESPGYQTVPHLSASLRYSLHLSGWRSAAEMDLWLMAPTRAVGLTGLFYTEQNIYTLLGCRYTLHPLQIMLTFSGI